MYRTYIKYKKYLKKNLIHPTDGKSKDMKGEVTLTFIADEEGTPQHIIILKSLCDEADKETIRLVTEGSNGHWAICPHG